MKSGLSNARLLPNRYEIKKHLGFTIINDAYNANPKSMQEALKTLKDYQCEGRRFFVIGDMLELGDLAESAHEKLGAEVTKYSIRTDDVRPRPRHPHALGGAGRGV